MANLQASAASAIFCSFHRKSPMLCNKLFVLSKMFLFILGIFRHIYFGDISTYQNGNFGGNFFDQNKRLSNIIFWPFKTHMTIQDTCFIVRSVSSQKSFKVYLQEASKTDDPPPQCHSSTPCPPFSTSWKQRPDTFYVTWTSSERGSFG